MPADVFTWSLGARVIPVVTVHDAALGVPLADALSTGGLTVLEVTLRTDAALEAVRRVRAELPDVVCGAGTVLTPADVEAAAEAGAQFLVSPGSSPALLEAMRGSGLPCLPGACTPSEAMAVLDAGFEVAKLYPASVAGGIPLLTALAGPLPALRWCPTGGVSLDSAPDYLALPQVVAVGGSWMAPAPVVANRDWDQVRALARETVQRIATVPHLRPA